MRTIFRLKWLAVALVPVVSVLAIPAAVSAAKPIRFFEETAEAFWEVPFACADGATATGQVTFDGALIADGPSNHPTRPAPFIRVDIER